MWVCRKCQHKNKKAVKRCTACDALRPEIPANKTTPKSVSVSEKPIWEREPIDEASLLREIEGDATNNGLTKEDFLDDTDAAPRMSIFDAATNLIDAGLLMKALSVGIILLVIAVPLILLFLAINVPWRDDTLTKIPRLEGATLTSVVSQDIGAIAVFRSVDASDAIDYSRRLEENGFVKFSLLSSDEKDAPDAFVHVFFTDDLLLRFIYMESGRGRIEYIYLPPESQALTEADWLDLLLGSDSNLFSIYNDILERSGATIIVTDPAQSA